ncbi:hypothetical protein KUF71_010523 [Frankliniella fusca]|uniref:Uncharacterized protein n=1 Tax=Frankliniella fusca TaxID=407009 RepID=A0AAE1HHM9_9NEOP|nr:hypothetical protein KUF71_010523 [Frankliniella fusca]
MSVQIVRESDSGVDEDALRGRASGSGRTQRDMGCPKRVKGDGTSKRRPRTREWAFPIARRCNNEIGSSYRVR